jgi:secreted PhoX family phosphatase
MQDDDDTAAQPTRRELLRGGLGLSTAAFFAPLAGCAALTGNDQGPRLGFKSVPISSTDALTVAEGYTATPLAPWGEPAGIVGQPLPAWRPDASNSAAEQALQMGMHHDGMHFYPLEGSSRHGLLAINHEYTDDGLLHPGGLSGWTAEKVRKSQASHGIAVIEIKLGEQAWELVRPSRYARRITAHTPCAVAGPAAGHPMMKTAGDPAGRTVLGTISNCAAGQTPWGTFLSGEENFKDYFARADQPTAHEKRYAITRGTWYRWHEHDERFDAVRHPNEPNRFGWVVEVDPMDPASPPVKRTALGRAAHEGAWVAVTQDQRAVVYSGEDAAFEYIYKFVSRDAIQPGGAKPNRELLDHGTLYVARFNADGTGRWLPLVHGQGPLTAANGFADQGEVVIKARQASDALGGTRMDRPEWLAIDHPGRWVYCSLTNNTERGQPDKPGIDAANPRARNEMGQIIRWREEGDFDGLAFVWNHLLLAGDPQNTRAEARGNVIGDPFSSPDTLAIDRRGVLWIGTDITTSKINQGEMARLGNNELLACNPVSGEVRRFLTGPVNCEITACCWTPDGRTMFVNVQHPGESPIGERNDAAQPRRFSNWPDYLPEGRPRSATVVIRRLDGGVIGA